MIIVTRSSAVSGSTVSAKWLLARSYACGRSARKSLLLESDETSFARLLRYGMLFVLKLFVVSLCLYVVYGFLSRATRCILAEVRTDRYPDLEGGPLRIVRRIELRAAFI